MGLSIYKYAKEKSMITLFNRKELVMTNDMTEQSRIRSELNAENIDYVIRTKSPSGVNGSRTQLMRGINYQYVIYVRKADYANASYAIRKNK